MENVTDLQKVAIEAMLSLKKLDLGEMTLHTLGVVIESFDLLSHQEAVSVIRYSIQGGEDFWEQ